MSDWIKKYRLDYTDRIWPDYININYAALFLLNIKVNSILGEALMKNYNPCPENSAAEYSKHTIPHTIAYFDIGLAMDPTRYSDIRNNLSSYNKLQKAYSKYSLAIYSSSLAFESANVNERNGGTYENTRVKVTKLIEWADEKSIPVDKRVRAAYPIAPEIILPATATRKVLRMSKYNQCIIEAINDFTEVTGYAPTTIDEVIGRMKNKPPHGFSIEFKDKQVSIDNSTPYKISDLKRAIERQLLPTK
jgi:hypothetical protein